MDEDAVAVLEEAGTIKQGTVSKNDYASDDNYNSYNILDNKFQIPHKLTYGLEGFTSLELQVSVTVNSYTADNNTGNPSVLIYAMNSKYGNWTQDEYEITEAPQTVDLKLDLSVYSTLGEIGLRFGGCDLGTHINYTINYAKVIGEGESNAGVGTLEVQYPLTGETKDLPFSETPVGQHGKLTVAEVEGYSAPTIVDKNGEAYQLRGASSHGMAWFPDYINKGAYQSLRDEWGMNLARITVYAREGGYTTGAEEAARDDALIQKGVQAATELGMYVIIDWHVLNYNPNEDLEAAKAFFTKYVELYGDYDNVLFEICNEPTGTEWYDGSENDLYTYCKTVTKLIRDAGSDAIVICGTNKYSSEVDKVAEKPLSVDGFTNVMYTYHFYAATHYEDEQQKVERALKAGIPVFVSEYGVCTANGDGEYDLENAEKWLNLFDANNVSYACWAMSNSEESAAYFVHDCEKKEGGWLVEDLTNTGRFLVNYYNTRKNILETCQHTEIEVRNQKAATCKEEGFTGDKYCKTCYKPLEMGKVVPKTETHSWNGGVVTTPATETEDGVKTYTCSVCQITKTEKIPATGTTTSQTDAKAPAISKATAIRALPIRRT